MKKSVRAISLMMVLMLFAFMALGSGSSSSSSFGDKASEESPSSSDGGYSSSSSGKTNQGSSSSEKVKYEVGEGRAVVYTNSIGTARVQISVPVKNTGNVNLYLSAGTMDLEDADGHLFDSISLVSVYPQVIKPGETAWYFEERMLDRKPESDLKVVPHVDVEKATVDRICYEVSDLSISDGEYGGVKITGRAENKTMKDDSMPYVAAFLYGSDGSLLGVLHTVIMDGLKAGDKMGFSVSPYSSSYDEYSPSDVARYDVYVYPFQYQFG